MKKWDFEELDGSFVFSGIFDERGLRACALASMHRKSFAALTWAGELDYSRRPGKLRVV